MNINIKPVVVLYLLLSIIGILLALHIVDIAATFYFGIDHYLANRFDFNFGHEGNVPTVYSSFAIFFASLLLFLIARSNVNDRDQYYYWYGLSLIFLFLSLDELFSFHERVHHIVKGYLDTSGLFYFAWVIPYGLAVIIIALIYLRFVFSLPKKIKYLFLVSGFVFVSGAIGFEMIGGAIVESTGRDNFTYLLYMTFEELLEMLGIAIFIYALLSYMDYNNQTFTIYIK